MTDPVDIQNEGTSDRLLLGVETMGDAQDIAHPFVGSVHGAWCSTCGLSRSYRRHDPSPAASSTGVPS